MRTTYRAFVARAVQRQRRTNRVYIATVLHRHRVVGINDSHSILPIELRLSGSVLFRVIRHSLGIPTYRVALLARLYGHECTFSQLRTYRSLHGLRNHGPQFLRRAFIRRGFLSFLALFFPRLVYSEGRSPLSDLSLRSSPRSSTLVVVRGLMCFGVCFLPVVFLRVHSFYPGSDFVLSGPSQRLRSRINRDNAGNVSTLTRSVISNRRVEIIFSVVVYGVCANVGL